MKTKKKLLILLSAVVLTATLITCFALFAGAESVTPEMKIGYCNLSFADNIRIKYAVSSNVDGVDLLVWRSPVSDYVYGTQDDVLTYSYTENIGGVLHYIFDFDEFSAKNMTDYVYTRAHVKVGDVDYYSDVNKYSILQYAQNMIAKSSDQKLIKLLTKMLEYGAAVQEYHGYKTDRLATASWYSVKLTAGSLPDGMREGLYLTGETVTLTAPDKDGTKSFSHWIDSEGKKVSSPVSVGKKNETYTPVYVNCSTGLTYVSNGDGTCYVSGTGTCTDTEIIIPPTSPEGDSVTSIGYRAFRYCTSLASITIPDSVTSIGERAFSGCKNLASITIPDSVTSIGNYAFDGCTNLKTVNYTGDIESWLKISFNDYRSNPCYYGASLYFGGELVTDVVVPDTITKINNYAFIGCTSLASITIPDSVTSIGWSAFEYCTNLKTVNYTGDIESWLNISFSSSSANPCCNGASLNFGGELVTDVVVPNTITKINDYAFRGCTSLASITIPDSVTSIGWSAFEGCTSLAKVYYGGTAYQWSGMYIDRYNSELTGATRYYYSETEPTESGNYWHYVDGVVTEW